MSYVTEFHSRFLCCLRSIETHRDHFVRRLSVSPSVCLSVCHTRIAMFRKRHVHSLFYSPRYEIVQAHLHVCSNSMLKSAKLYCVAYTFPLVQLLKCEDSMKTIYWHRKNNFVVDAPLRDHIVCLSICHALLLLAPHALGRTRTRLICLIRDIHMVRKLQSNCLLV